MNATHQPPQNENAEVRDGGKRLAPYQSPTLVVYGQLRALTAGGAGSVMEGMLMTSMVKFP